jgi:hypothetical protein
MKNAIPRSMMAPTTATGTSTLVEIPEEDEAAVGAGVVGVAVSSSSPPPLVKLESASEGPRLAPLPPAAEPVPAAAPAAVPAPAAPLAPFSAWAFARASWTAVLMAALSTVGVPAAAATPAARASPAKHVQRSVARSGMYEEIRRIGLETARESENSA